MTNNETVTTREELEMQLLDKAQGVSTTYHNKKKVALVGEVANAFHTACVGYAWDLVTETNKRLQEACDACEKAAHALEFIEAINREDCPVCADYAKSEMLHVQSWLETIKAARNARGSVIAAFLKYDRSRVIDNQINKTRAAAEKEEINHEQN